MACFVLVQKIGENIQVCCVYMLDVSDGLVFVYVYSGKIGVLVLLKGGNDELGKDVVMYVVVVNLLVVDLSQVDQVILDKECEIYSV